MSVYMSDIPKMSNPGNEKLLDYLESGFGMHFHFARILNHVAPWEPWKQSNYHVLAALVRGGPITRRFQTADGAGELVPQTVNTVTLLPAHRRRRIEKVDDPEVELRVAVVSYTLFRTDLLAFWDFPLLFDPRAGTVVGEMIDALIQNSQEEKRHPLPQIVERNRLCHAILEQIIAVSTLKPDVLEKMVLYRDIEPALLLLNERYMEPLTGDEIAACCRWSRSHFHDIFRRVTGTSPQGYQKQLRISEVKRLLVQTDMGVTDVGMTVGWNDPFHFSRIFKQETGSSPSHFRKQFRGDAAFHA